MSFGRRCRAMSSRSLPSWVSRYSALTILGMSLVSASLKHRQYRVSNRLLAARMRWWAATVALDSAVYDVPAMMTARHLRLYDRAFGADPAGWRAASPIDRIAGRPAPLLLVCSTRRDTSWRAGIDGKARVSSLKPTVL